MDKPAWEEYTNRHTESTTQDLAREKKNDWKTSVPNQDMKEPFLFVEPIGE